VAALKSELGDRFSRFENNAKEWECFFSRDGQQFLQLYDYAEVYCRMDVAILVRGFSEYRRVMLAITGQCAFKCLTITTLGNNFITRKGTYDGCYLLPCEQRQFVERSLVGGRVTTAVCGPEDRATIQRMDARTERLRQLMTDPEAKIFDASEGGPLFDSSETLCDIDSNSCYPASWVIASRAGGIPAGIPSSMERTTLTELERFPHYIAQVTVVKVHRKSSLPIMSYRNEENIRTWSNDMEGRTVVLNSVDVKLWREYCVFSDNVRFSLVWTQENDSSSSAELVEGLYKRRKEAKANGEKAKSAAIVSFSYYSARIVPTSY